MNRKIAPSSKVKILFDEANQGETVMVNRDVFSVISCLTSKLASLKDQAALDGIKVSVHSLEDPEKSDPLPEGESRYEGPYGVGGIGIENMSIPDALSALTGGILPAEWCIKNVEILANELFLRSRLDGLFFVATFNSVPVASMLLNSMREFNPSTVVAAYKAIKVQAENLKEWGKKQFPDVKEEDWESPLDADAIQNKAQEEAEKRAEKLVLPSGIPAKAAQEGIKTPEELRKAGPKIVHLY